MAEQKGYREATIAEIIAAAHVSKTTFYEQFTGKEGLYLALHAMVADAVYDAVEDALRETADEADWRTRIRTIVTAYVETMASDPKFLTQIRIESAVATDGSEAARFGAAERFSVLLIGESTRMAETSPEVVALTLPICFAGMAGQTSLVAAAAAHGPDAVRSLAEDLFEWWLRLLQPSSR